jgi:hypothetical protein
MYQAKRRHMPEDSKLHSHRRENLNSLSELLGFVLCPSSGILKTREHRTIGKVQKPGNSECYTPSSEPFRIYSNITFEL